MVRSQTKSKDRVTKHRKKCKSIPGTRRFHQFKPSDNNTEVWASINTQRQTDNVSENTSIHQEDSFVDAGISDVIHSGDYIIVEYNGKKSSRRFVGQVNEIKKGEDGMEFNVLFMRKKDASGYLFGFPERVDMSWICASQIAEKLVQPVMHGRGQFKFPTIIKSTD